MMESLRDVSIGVHSKDLRSVDQREPIDVVHVLLHSLVDWNSVALVEVEAGLEHTLIEPVLERERDQVYSVGRSWSMKR